MSYGKEVFSSRGEEFYHKVKVLGGVRMLKDWRHKVPELTSEELEDITLLLTT